MALKRTYLTDSLKNGLIVRWPDKSMPIKVHIAPFRWYQEEKQAEAYTYKQMVLNAMQHWTTASKGVVKFQIVKELLDSQINVVWRRVDRKRLGHCQYHINENSMLFSAEVSIGISDGKVHAQYSDPREVQETITHEFGHAIGIVGHSDSPADIMYPARLYGQYEGLSERDCQTVQWLYKLPVGFDYEAAGRHHKLKPPYDINDVIAIISGETPSDQPRFEQTLKQHQIHMEAGRDGVMLDRHHDILTHQGKFWLMTQNLQTTQKSTDAFEAIAMQQIHRERQRHMQQTLDNGET